MRRIATWRKDRNFPALAAFAAAAFLLCAGILMAAFEEELYSTQQIKNVREQAQILAASVTAAIVFDDAKTVREHLEALKANTELQGAGVYDRSGKVVASFGHPTAQMLARPTATGEVYANGHIDVAEPVMQGTARVGTVFLSAVAESTERRLARYSGLVLLVTMGALVILVLSISQSALTRRARELVAVNLRLQGEIEERRRTEEALRQSSKMEAVGQLSGGIAHDFNNLIMITKSNLQIMRRRLGADIGRIGTYIASAEEALDRAASLTQRILAFSRRQPLSPVPVQLSALIANMAELLRHSVADGAVIETALKSEWWVCCDVNQMENVVLNLAINARDAMPDGGILTIETKDEPLTSPPPDAEDFVAGDYVLLVVRDTGVGMSEEIRRRAVDPFFTTKPPGKGTGLGLSMAFGFVRQSNGHLDITSRQGAGTTVTLYMPRYKEGQHND